MREKDNRGMSLVELIIVIALMSVIAGVSGYGLSLISNKPVEECTRKVEMILNRNRTNSMGKSEAWVEFYINDDGLLTYQEHLIGGIDSATEQVSAPVVIGAQGVNLAITYSGMEPIVLSTGKLYTVAFSRDSGAVKDHVDKEGTHSGCEYSSCEHGVCKKIEIFKGTYSPTGNNKTIELDKLTGKVTIK